MKRYSRHTEIIFRMVSPSMDDNGLIHTPIFGPPLQNFELEK